MLKSKKKLLPILSLIFVLAAVCLLWLSPAKTSVYADIDEPKQVSLREFQVFNIYTEDSRKEDAITFKNGMLLRFDDVLSDNLSARNGGIKTVNLVDLYGENIFIDDMPLDFYEGAEIYYYLEEYIWIYIPNFDASVYRTMSVKEPFVFEDRMITPFVLHSKLVTTVIEGYGEISSIVWSRGYMSATQPQNVEFESIEWNNTGHWYFKPKNGLLLKYDKKLSNVKSEFEGAWMRTNLVNHDAIKNAFLGEGKSVDENIFLYDADGNAIAFKDIPGAEISYHSNMFLWLYVPDMINYTKLEIKEGTLFLDSYLPGTVLYSNGTEWVDYNPNVSRANITPVSYEKIEWNNYDYSHRDGKNGILIKFSDYLSKLDNEISGSIQKINKVKTGIGEHIKLNSTPLKDMPGTEICYHNQYFLWIYIPGENLSLSGGFPRLTIDENTEFLNAVLPAMTLYFDGTYWLEDAPGAYQNNAFKKISYNNINVEDGLDKGYVYTVLNFNQEFLPPLEKGDENGSRSGSRPNLAQAGDVGQKIRINGRTLNELYMEDNNTCCKFNENDALYLLFRKSYLFTDSSTTPTLTIESGTRFVDRTIGALTLYLVDGEWSETDKPSAPLGEDTDAPYIYYYGADEFLVIADKEGGVSDFLSGLSVYLFDERDGNLTFTVADNVEIPDGATTDDKWNSGEWTVKIVATDSHNNKSEKEISITAIDSDKEYLSVYINGTFSYRIRYGEKVRKDIDLTLQSDPTKADNRTSCFIFTGWTVNGKLWDFENDVATEDVWISASFGEYRRLFTLTVKDTETGNTDVFTVKYGDVIDFSEYKKDGYSVLAKIDDTVVKSVSVHDDLDVELQYVPISESGGVKSIIIILACWAGAAVLAAAGMVLYKKYGKKAGDKQ